MEQAEEAEQGDEVPPELRIHAPTRPTRKEFEEHVVSHFPFWSWCEACVRGKAKANPHRKIDHTDETTPVVTVDYCFMNSRTDDVVLDEKTHAPILVVRDRWTKHLFAHVLPYKGVTKGPYGSKVLLNDIKKLGYSKLIIRHDPEPALTSVVEAVKNGFEGTLIIEKSPKGVKESKGEIERAVQTLEGQARTLRAAIESNYGEKLPDDSPVLTWLVEHASTVYNLFFRSTELQDGKTPYSRLRGREWKVAIPPFGEAIEYLKRGHKFEAQWTKGIFLGVKDTTTEKIVGNSTGVFTVQSIRRKPEEDRYDSELLKSITGIPWDPQAIREEPAIAAPREPVIASPSGEALVQPPAIDDKKRKLRRLYITKKDLEKFGYTAGCPACDATQIGKRSTGIHHTNRCRDRLEESIRGEEEENPRVARHESRVGEAITGMPQPVSGKRPQILHGYESKRPSGVPDSCRVFARLDVEAYCFQTTMPGGPDWSTVWHRVTRNHANNAIIESGVMTTDLPPEILNGALPHKMDIVTELWYEPEAAPPTLGTASASASGIRRPREPEPHGEKREHEEQHEPAGSPTAKARVDRDKKRKAEGEHEDEAERTRDIQSIEMALESLILEDRERVLSSIDPEKPVCEEKIPLPEEMAEEARDWWYYDDISGKELLPEKVEKARKDEIDIVESMGVWEKIPRSKVPKGTKIIGTRWVDVNKQDETNPLYRSRLVAQEIKRGSGFDEFFAAMPSLAALKLLLTIAVSDSLPLEKGERRKAKQSFLGFLDVKRAHFYSKATRELYVEIPSEGKKPEDGDVVGRLVRSLYGTRDAPMNWELTIAEFMKKLGFVQGKSNPCIYYHASRELRTEVHGDDFTTVGSFDDIKWFHTSAAKEWQVVERGILGPPGSPKASQQIRVLNRIITWSNEGIWWEPDPRHAELIIKWLGTGQPGKVKTPLAKPSQEELQHEEVPLSAEDATMYRSIAMRAAYLAQDRPDLQTATRSLAQGLQNPTSRHWNMLKRLARYVRYRPRVAQLFPNQSTCNPFNMWSDADHAGCIRTRKSVSGGVLMANKCCLTTYSKGQGVVSLSSGESEYYGLVSGACQMLGIASTARDWGLFPSKEVTMDASAGIAMGNRRGLGRAKHVDTQYHWVQERTAKKEFRLKKEGTDRMLADVLTKAVTEEKMTTAMKGMNFHYLEGEHELTLKA